MRTGCDLSIPHNITQTIHIPPAQCLKGVNGHAPPEVFSPPDKSEAHSAEWIFILTPVTDHLSWDHGRDTENAECFISDNFIYSKIPLLHITLMLSIVLFEPIACSCCNGNIFMTTVHKNWPDESIFLFFPLLFKNK